MRAWLICSMISSKCAALFPESLIITIYNLHKEIWYCKNSKSFKTKRSQKSLKTCHFNSTFVINWYFTDFFTNENPRKFVEKQKMIFFYIFHVYLDNSKRTITQGTSAPEDFLPRGNFGQKIFPQEAFVQERPSLPRRPFFSKKMSTSLELLCKKSTPSGKVCGLKQECWQNRNQTLGDCSKRKVDLQTKEQLWNFLLLRAWFYFSQAIQSYV